MTRTQLAGLLGLTGVLVGAGVGVWWLTRPEPQRPRRPPPEHKRPSGVLSEVPPPPDVAVDSGGRPRHLIVVSIDTLRADYLGCYGSTWVKTPTIDALCADGAVFDHHISAAPTTLASHTSLFTGTFPHTHGVPRNGFVVDDGNVTLAEVLQESDFTTAAFVGAFPLDPRFGLQQGFQHYDSVLTTAFVPGENQQAQRPANEVTDAVLRFVDSREPDKERLLLFVHYFDVHAPYIAPRGYAGMYRSWTELGSDIVGSMDDIAEARRDLESGTGGPIQDALKKEYAAGVTWVDAELGRLIERLGPVADDAVLVITSDHGEVMDEPVEHWNHGHSVHHAAVRTPLVIRSPGVGAARYDTVVSNVDVFPTALDLLGVEAPGSEGRSLRPLLDGQGDDRVWAFAEATKPHTVELKKKWRNSKMCRTAISAQYKWVFCPHDGTKALYALPDEQTDVQANRPKKLRKAKRALKTWHGEANPLPSSKDTKPEVKELLEELGYIER